MIDRDASLGMVATLKSPSSRRRGLESRSSTLDGEFRTQDAPFVVRALLMSVHAREQVWRFVRQHWEAMAARYPASAYRRMWEGIVGLATPALERGVLDLFRATGIDLGGKKLAQYLEQLRVAVAVHERGPWLEHSEGGFAPLPSPD